MKKKIFIFGHTGYIGSYLLKYLNNEDFITHGTKIPRPGNVKLYDFYYKFISDFLNENNDIFCVINSAGSINCETKEDFFFNSKFDVIFQEVLKEKKIKIKYLSFNSTKTFSNALDKYALSKKDLDKNLRNSEMFFSLYIDLVFDDNSPHFKTINDKLQKIKVNIVPVFNPGKYFYPINLISLGNSVKNIICGNYQKNKFIIIGNKKMSFCELIKYVNEVSNQNKKIYYISSKIINCFPNFIKKFLQKSKTLQQYDDYDWLEKISYNEFLIRKFNDEF